MQGSKIDVESNKPNKHMQSEKDDCTNQVYGSKRDGKKLKFECENWIKTNFEEDLGLINASDDDTKYEVQKESTEEDNKLLSMILSRNWNFPKDQYTIVRPEARSYDLKFLSSILKSFEGKGYDVTELMRKLLKINGKPIKLTLKSAKERGFFVDYKGIFNKYFDDNGGGWDKMYEENTDVRGITTVSVPVRNEKD